MKVTMLAVLLALGVGCAGQTDESAPVATPSTSTSTSTTATTSRPTTTSTTTPTSCFGRGLSDAQYRSCMTAKGWVPPSPAPARTVTPSPDIEALEERISELEQRQLWDDYEERRQERDEWLDEIGQDKVDLPGPLSR